MGVETLDKIKLPATLTIVFLKEIRLNTALTLVSFLSGCKFV